MHISDVGKRLLLLTDGVAGTMTDTCLLQLYFINNLYGATHPAQIYRAQKEALNMLDGVNYKKIKQTLYNLCKKGLIERSSRQRHADFQITSTGKARIAEIFPSYHKNRPWDGYIYLVSYDISTRANHKRNILRAYLKKIAGGKLQDSLWLSPYDPTDILHDFVKQYTVPGRILISKIGKDGSIGEETLEQLIEQIYSLGNLQEKYRDFLRAYGDKKASPTKMALEYGAILKDDPQLPFPLEPAGFLAGSAHTLFQSYFRQF